jgi:hypothetical protein
VYGSQLRLHWAAVPGIAQRIVRAARHAAPADGARYAAPAKGTRHAVEHAPTTIIPIARSATGRAAVGGYPGEVA